MTLTIRQLSHALGAEVSGVDISRPLSDDTFHKIRQVFLDRCLLLFRGRPLTRAQFVAFSRRFGELNKTQSRALPDYPEINTVVNTPKSDGSPADPDFNGSDWHTDNSYRVNPNIISMLKAVVVPPIGGDTQFANHRLAYETLSDGMKKLIDGLEGVHMQQEHELDHSSPQALEASRRAKTVAHPLVRMHPETGLKSLYIGDKVMLIAGMTPEESRPLIDFLRQHARHPQFVYRHTWQRDDLVVWDQRCTNHNALGDFDRRTQPRHLDKTTVVGPVVGRLYQDTTGTRNTTGAFTM